MKLETNKEGIKHVLSWNERLKPWIKISHFCFGWCLSVLSEGPVGQTGHDWGGRRLEMKYKRTHKIHYIPSMLLLVVYPAPLLLVSWNDPAPLRLCRCRRWYSVRWTRIGSIITHGGGAALSQEARPQSHSHSAPRLCGCVFAYVVCVFVSSHSTPPLAINFVFWDAPRPVWFEKLGAECVWELCCLPGEMTSLVPWEILHISKKTKWERLKKKRWVQVKDYWAQFKHKETEMKWFMPAKATGEQEINGLIRLRWAKQQKRLQNFDRK